MARQLLHSALVIVLRALILAIAVALAGPAGAAEVEDRAARVTALETRHRALGEERTALARTYGERAAAVSALKAQPSSWARDRKLQGLLAESKDMAALLDRMDGELRAQASLLLAERRALLAALDRELAAAPEPARAEALGKRREELARVLAAHERRLRLPDDTIDPADDPADLDYKAGALAQGERSLRAEEQRLVARATYFRRQAKLARSRSRADEADVFHDEAPRRGGAPVRREGTVADGEADPATRPPPFGSPPTAEVPPGTGSTAGLDGRGADLAADPSVILVDVVAQGTLDELRRAERSGDPESMARAAERASAEVRARAERLRARRLEMERRARDLRGETP
jgi:hypothetical protein